jgi:hypothetical protein
VNTFVFDEEARDSPNSNQLRLQRAIDGNCASE